MLEDQIICDGESKNIVQRARLTIVPLLLLSWQKSKKRGLLKEPTKH